MNNPLLNFDQLPFFKSIEAAHVLPALESILDECRASITQLERIDEPNWPNFAQVMENLDERVGRVWSPVGHLNAVNDSAELREAYQTGIALLTEYHSELGQNQKLYSQYIKLQQSEGFTALSPAQQKVISNSVLDFKLSGAELYEQDQLRLSEVNKQLSELSNRFERNLMDATQSWEKLVIDPAQLAGLPSSALEMALQLAVEAGKEGHLFNLQIPSYIAVMQHADNRDFRREMYLAYTTRASELSESPEFDNSDLIVDILKLRREKANLLGYNNYADYSLVKKMAKSSDTVTEFLHDLVTYAKPVAVKELAELKTFADSLNKAAATNQKLEAWDISYYSEKLRESRYSFNDEQVKPYFPAPLVFDGMFEIVNRLFGIKLQENFSIETWQDDVRCFDVSNQQNQLIGQLYTDLYVRKNKRGGAWMDSCIDRRVINGDVQLPVAFLTCNFSPPIGDEPALLTHDEV
ncbi:MAG: oligopeptidase A, partial [Cryomorphaceae bacterium]